MSDRTVTIPDEILDGIVSDRHIYIIARKYLVDWETLRPHLSCITEDGITEAQEQNIANKHDKDEEWKRRQLLRLWKREAGNEATYRALITAAEESGDFNLANNIRKLLQRQIPLTQLAGMILHILCILSYLVIHIIFHFLHLSSSICITISTFLSTLFFSTQEQASSICTFICQM